MSNLRELYQEVILDHNRNPRNSGELENANRFASGDNPLCGDKIRLFVLENDGVISDIRFSGVGCAISTASASLMTEAVKGKTLREALALFDAFHKMLTHEVDLLDLDPILGKLAVFSGVREFPVRVKCATLSWHTVKAALAGSGEPVSTE